MQQISEVPPGFFDKETLSSFDFVGYKIDSLPIKEVLIKKIIRAKFVRCQLSNIPDGIFSYVYIRELDFSENSIKNLNNSFFLQLECLTKLDLCFNKLSNISCNFPVSLAYLDLSFNPNLNIKSIWDLENTKLEVVKLNSCGIKEIPRTVPKWSETIKSLSFDGNFIQKIPNVIFSLPQIEDLSFFGNNITSVSKQSFSHLMKNINFSMNPIKTAKFENDSDIQIVNFNYSLLKEVNSGLLLIKGLKILHLNNCKIEGLLDFCFPENIAIFNAAHNQITAVSERFASSSGFLSVLNLSYNRIESLPNSFPTQTTYMSQLLLSHNNLRDIPSTLLNSRLMEKFIVSHNNINNLAEFAFPQIREFDVSFNELESVPDAFTKSTFLMTLNVSSNKLTNLPHSLTFCRKVTTLIANNNMFVELPKCVLSFATLKNLYLSGNRLTSLPLSLSSFFFLLTLDISNNHFQSLPSFTANLMTLKYLNASHNLIENILESFHFPCKLTFLDLSYNLLTEFSSTSLNGVITLSLDYNQLTHFSIGPSDTLKNLSLSSNRNLKVDLNELLTNFPNLKLIESFNVQQSVNFNRITAENLDIHHISSDLVLVSDDTEYGIGCSSTIGFRPTMEDSISINSNKSRSLFALFDGHAGGASSIISSAFMSKSDIGKLKDPKKDTKKEFVKIFESIQTELKKSLVTDGCTAIATLIIDDICHITCIGDSRIVKITKNGFERLTVDEKPMDPDEFKRLKDRGIGVASDGRVEKKLSISNTLGDFWCESGLFSPPKIKSFKIREDDIGLIMACDGLWDVLDDTDAAAIFREARNAMDAAAQLKNCAFANGSLDNITVLTVEFHPNNQNEKGLCYVNQIERLPVVDEKEDEDDQPLVIAPSNSPRRRARR